MSIKAIVNADDFGYSKMVSDAILECLRKQFISQTTLMVNMPFAKEAVEAVKREGFADRVGLHLNLGEGKPLTRKITECPKFCDDSGCFNGVFRRKRYSSFWFSTTKKERIALREEICAQFEEYMGYGLSLKHLDGHYHHHLPMPIFCVAAKMMRKFDFNSYRKPYSMSWFEQRALELKTSSAFTKLFTLGQSLRTVDYFGSVADYRRYCHHFPNAATIEIMVHPQFDVNGRLIDKDAREGVDCDEMAQIKGMLVSDDADLVSYKECFA